MNRKQSIDSSKAFSNFCHTFQNEWLPILGVTDERVYSPKLDVLVIGSDEVFNCTQSNLDVGYSPQLFGYENSAEKLITYAASFGSTTIEKLDKYGKTTEISNLLKEFDAISVRDKNSHDIIKTLTAIDPIDSIDPVLLYDFSNEVDNIDVDLSNYIVVYAYSERINKIEAEAIQAFAHSKGKKTLSIGVKQSFTDLYVNVDPFTLLAYIKNADYVITDTFHGTVFSIMLFSVCTSMPGSCLIQNQNCRVTKQCSRKRNQLFLSLGKHGPTLPHLCFISFRHFPDKRIGTDNFSRFFNFLLCGIQFSVPDIICNCSRKNKTVLHSTPHLRTRNHDFSLILAYHTQGEVIYWKYLDEEPEGARRIAEYFAKVSGYRIEETPAASGYAGYKDWFINFYDRPGYTIEAGLGENPLPMEQFSKIYKDNVGILLGGMTELE